ncbi:phosphatase PAP2 family protein [Amycolatopsis pithecellobii]|uniref:Phosphatase PAP2 family protein n=1 Tax=Amycolatopsis pithecellobii TaxID=664692 RepID=A0A6N7ZCX9_9PSEU|nr:phosphatase PAP2 family protein [Amycolatopsis pithecellobii]MTD59545.1 phosphatase PAP2 family protein [Amycolatopsis pithecellobii]
MLERDKKESDLAALGVTEERAEGRRPPRAESQKTGKAKPEVALLAKVQRTLKRPQTVKAARGMSHFGEHAIGWIAAGLVGAAIDRKRRKDWLVAAGGVAAAHGASIAVKRVVRRPRPEHPDVEVLVGTPSRLSFPSSHATSTTAAAVLYSGLTGRNLVPALVPPMLASRLVLGVHYPTDVLAGAALGGVVGGLLRRKIRKQG